MSEANDDPLNDIQRTLVNFLRSFEGVQQSILFQDIGPAQRELEAAVGNSLSDATKSLGQINPGSQDDALIEALGQALGDLTDAYTMFTREGGWPEFGHAFLSSRTHYCRALELLYANRVALAGIDDFFRLSDVDSNDAKFNPAPKNTGAAATGLMHVQRTQQHHDYSLYVPEYYADHTTWPMIVALHGGYGRGDEYIWSWLRAARSRGYVVLSPKSIGPTWSIMQPALDADSIMAMLDSVAETYTIDRARVLLTGLSDGGSFSYLLGLQHHQRFAGLAPIAGVLNPMADPLLRAGRGRELPMHVIHGVHDAIFAVQTIRSNNELMRSLGYQLTYTELPDWGHALTTSINETIVLPWFERLQQT